MKDEALQEMLHEVDKGELLMAALSSPKNKADSLIGKITIRSILIKNELFYQITEHHPQKVMHRNLGLKECALFIQNALKNYRQGVFTTHSHSYHVLVSKLDKITVIKKTLKPEQPTLNVISHNRTKNYLLKEGVPVPFLVTLGIMTADGKVVAKKYDKFRQINRFVEMVSDTIEHLPKDRPIQIIDFGCGKAYLTFALHHYLHVLEKREVNILGLDLKADVVTACQTLAAELKLKGLKFAVGDINSYPIDGAVDLVISLHACDTATDAALEKAVRWDAKVILCVPCCQHELYSQVKNNALESLLRHGILRERFAALATDAARAELLTALGYDVQILEFIDMEHTPKNLLIRAIKGSKESRSKQAHERYSAFKNALQISPSLENRFKDVCVA